MSRTLEESLQELKDELRRDNKKNFWLTVAGSSVIATLLGVLANFGIESYKARLNHDLEQFKVEVQNKNTQLAETREAYSKLAGQLEKVEDDLRSYVSTCEIAAQNPREDAQFAKWAAQSWDSLTNHIGDMATTQNNIKIDPTISREITNLIGQILSTEDAANRIPHKNSDLVNKKEQLFQSIAKIKSDIEQKRNSLAL